MWLKSNLTAAIWETYLTLQHLKTDWVWQATQEFYWNKGFSNKWIKEKVSVLTNTVWYITIDHVSNKKSKINSKDTAEIKSKIKNLVLR